MSYDYGPDGEKIFYEPEESENTKLDYDGWYDSQMDNLIDKYISDNPEEFQTDDSMADIERHGGFQSYCENEYDEYMKY